MHYSSIFILLNNLDAGGNYHFYYEDDDDDDDSKNLSKIAARSSAWASIIF